MEVQSPPKRITRARAAAKTCDSATTKPTKVVTAAAKAATTRAASSMKRKTRADENENDEESQQKGDAKSASASTPAVAMNKPPKTRGRPKKVAEPQSETMPTAPADEPPTTTTKARGRPKKTTFATVKVEPGRATRARATRKTQSEDQEADAQPEPVNKTTARSRGTSNTTKAGVACTAATTHPTPGLKSVVARPGSRIATVKKSVTFEEPEKENQIPAPAKAKCKTTETNLATGMRAKPVRKAAAGGRTTRASVRTTNPTEEMKDKPTPLSPKKDSQNRSLRLSSSDDELAIMEKTPLKPMMKSPVKPPSSKKLDLGIPAKEGPSEEDTEQPSESTGPSVLESPAKRPPASPFKDAMKSPAKRVDAVPSLILASTIKNIDGSQSPFKTSMLQSPAKRPHVPIQGLQASVHEQPGQLRSPMKMSLLHSPAKRPMSPLKLAGSPIRSSRSNVERPSSPDAFDEKSEAPEAAVKENIAMTDEDEDTEAEEKCAPEAVQLEFPGRLSAVMPRSADPAFQPSTRTLPTKFVKDDKRIGDEQMEPVASADDMAEDPMDIDEAEDEEANVSSPEPTPPRSAIRPKNPLFGLRNKDLNPYDSSESEDELASSGKGLSKFQDDTTMTFTALPLTPTPGNPKIPRVELPSSAIKAAGRAIRSVSKGSKLGFTPLARQLSDWKASSPLKIGTVATAHLDREEISLVEGGPSLAKGSFFDDEMKVRDDIDADEAAMIAAMEADIAANYDVDDPVFDDIPVTNEDVELAAEANEMSLLEPEQVDEMMDVQVHDDSISEASQEYGDENAVPIDPVLLGCNTSGSRQSMAAEPPVTPMRPSAARTLNTTTKVPLKPADDSTPRSMKRRSASVSRLPVKRPAGLSRNATVISYSPMKESSEDNVEQEAEENGVNPPVTPSKSDIWSSIGTPARTPRRDLNTALLRGAVVFVDVHTSEGADASTVFVDLLTQMGARCVKSWPWNPTSPTNSELSASKIGITHVVYKDGGKRTMEKVRESGGVVQCVGVGWVLDCERENEWLDEAPYYIDTSLVPRGGARRRKSMEPKALANLNGTLVTPMKQTAAPPRDCQTVPNNHISRRDSTLWLRTPSDRDEAEDMDAAGEEDWDAIGMLTPVPKTPAPEQIAQFALNVTPETPAHGNSSEYSSDNELLLMRTAPPKQSMYSDLGEGLLSQKKDHNVMMRLMAARRKSLQFAPKIASPLSKAWN